MILYIYICLWVSMTTFNSEDITLFFVRYTGGVFCKIYLVSHWHFLTFSYQLTVLYVISLTALKKKWRDHSEHWQFWMGGYIVRFTWCHTNISLYLPISWLFRMGSHWLHWKAKSSLWALAVSNGGVYHKIYLVSHWHFLISSYYLTVSNGHSLTALKSEELTLSSGSFNGGDNHQFFMLCFSSCFTELFCFYK